MPLKHIFSRVVSFTDVKEENCYEPYLLFTGTVIV
jgi:hypothetical protein